MRGFGIVHTMFFVFVVVMGMFAETTPGATYFVTTNGSNGNNGTSEVAAWATVAYAATQATAGDTVYIKAGNYGNETVTVANSGTSIDPITFEGYKLVPGDVSPPAYFDLHQAGGPPPPTLDPAEMPLWNGVFDFSGRSYVEARHFQIDGGTGVKMSSSDHITIDNYLADNCDRSVEPFRSDTITILNCQSKNATTFHFGMRGTTNSLIENCTSNWTTGPDADYHIRIEGYPTQDATGNVVRHCYAEGDAIGVHGIGMKNEVATGNLFVDCVARNFSNNFYVRHHNIYGNTFQDCTAYGGVNGYVARDGANDNTFINCDTVGTSRAFTCWDSSEDKGEGSNQGKNTYSCEGNTFTNCTFENTSQYGIFFDDVKHDSPAANNTFDNCTFDGGGTLILHETNDNDGNVIKNSTITGYANLENYNGGSGAFVFINNTWSNNGFPPPPEACGGPLSTRADFDNDGDVDANDFLTFSNCFNGALNPPLPTCADPCADLDTDGDVDANDFLTFSNCFNGALSPPACP